MLRFLILIFYFTIFIHGSAQINSAFADSIRVKYKIPELAYAVVSSDSIIEIQTLGFHKSNSKQKANINDKFRIGSCTKTITCYIAELLVKEGKLKWDTRFFDLYPELKSQSDTAYDDLTLQDLVTFRANLIPWSYDNDTPSKKEIKGDDQQQRYEFVSWVLKQKPVTELKTIKWSNPAYVAVGLMLEKVTGKKYETLVGELGKNLGITFEFGQPNLKDKNQPWGHDENGKPERPALNYKLNWLSSAGNINVSLPDFSKFIQLQLQGLSGKSKFFTEEEFEYFHFGLQVFSFGWYTATDSASHLKYSFHEGNPGTFLTKTYVYKDIDRAIIIFVNAQSDEAENGMKMVLEELKKKYIK